MEHNKDYQTLEEINAEENNELIEFLKEKVPNVFRDGVLNLGALKQELKLVDEDQEVDEKYGLDWKGKSDSLNKAFVPSDKTLISDKDKSFNFNEAKNIIIEGDNLEVLKLLQKSYFNKVDVIYIDPPYNTGHDFVYNDNFKEGSIEYKIQNGLIDDDGYKTTTNQKTEGRFHTNWLNMIYPRLVLAKKLLKEDGIIFISIDDNEQARLKIVCDEIFGEQNFVNQICWVSNRSGRQISNKLFAKTYEYILIYSKSDSIYTSNFEREYISNLMPDLYKNADIVLYEDEISKYMIQYELHNQNINKFNSKTRPNLYFPIYTNGKIISLSKVEGFKCIYPPSSNGKQGVWRWSKNKIQNELNNLIVKEVNGKTRIYPKKRNITFLGKDIILSSQINTKTGSNEIRKLNLDFDYSKPSILIKWLIKSIDNIDNKEGIILDFFAGSGTTAQAVMELNKEDGGNRKYILVQLPEKVENSSEFKTICDITRERVKRSIKMFKYQDKGFKSFKLVDSNFKINNMSNHDSNEEIQKNLFNLRNKIKEERTTEDLIYEIILKIGLPLTIKLINKKIDNFNIYYDDNINYLFILETNNRNYYDNNLINIIKNKYNNQSEFNVYLSDMYFQNDEDKLNLIEQIKFIDNKISITII